MPEPKKLHAVEIVDDSSEEDITVVEESYTVTIAAELLGVSREALEHILLSKAATDDGDLSVTVKRSTAQSAFIRDSIAANLYICLFNWVVLRSGTSLSFEKKSEESPSLALWIFSASKVPS